MMPASQSCLHVPRQPRKRDSHDQLGAGLTKEASRHTPGAPAPQGLHRISREVSRWEDSAALGFLVAKRMQVKTVQWFFLLNQPVGLVEI